MEHISKTDNQCYPHSRGRYVAGIILILVGVVFFLDNIEIIPDAVRDYLMTWQMLVIGIGVISLFSERSRYSGLILIGIGTFFFIPRLFDYDALSFSKMFWPLLLIFIGSMLILKHRDHSHFHRNFSFNQTTVDDKVDMLDEIAIFSGNKRIIQSKNFKGGRITSIFGGSEIDLSQAQLAEGSYYLEVTSIFGGTSIVVPGDWDIKVDVTSILGGFADKRRFNPNPPAPGRLLLIKGVAIFGGGEIKSI